MDWTASGRVDSFRYVRVSWPGFEEVGELALVTACTVEENELSDLKVTGSLDYAGDLDLGDDMVRVYSDSELAGEAATVCHATLLAAATSSDRAPGTAACRASLYSTLKVLQDERLAADLEVPEGADPVAWCASACADRHLPATASLPSGRELASPALFEAGETLLAVVNALLDAAGYASASVDAYGGVVLAPYEEPSYRRVECTVSESDPGSALVDAGYSREVDRSKVYNVVVAEGSDEEGNVIRAVARNDSAGSAWSTVSRRRTVTRFESVAEPATSEALRAKAEAWLAEATTEADRVTVSHFWAPFSMGSAVLVDFPSSGVCDRYTAVKRTCRMLPGMRCETVARRFVDLEVQP